MADPKARRPRPDDVEPEEAPVRKKKKKKKQQASKWPLIAGLAGGGVVVLILLILVIVKFAGGGAVTAPTEWEKYSVGENEFGFEVPVGWKVSEKGIPNKRDVQITKGSVKITIDENMTGSLVADIANAANRGVEVSDDLLPVSTVHTRRRPQNVGADYKEEPATTVNTRGYGKARQSVYTEGSKRGIRATVLRHQTSLDIFCNCRASDFDTLRPAFEKFIASFGSGN